MISFYRVFKNGREAISLWIPLCTMTISICDKSDLIKQKCQYWVGISIHRPFIQSFIVRGIIHNVHSRAGSREPSMFTDTHTHTHTFWMQVQTQISRPTLKKATYHLINHSGFERVPTSGRVLDFIAFMPWALLKFTHWRTGCIVLRLDMTREIRLWYMWTTKASLGSSLIIFSSFIFFRSLVKNDINPN